jgi:hypothetical protein
MNLQKIIYEGKEYNSVEELPPLAREAYRVYLQNGNELQSANTSATIFTTPAGTHHVFGVTRVLVSIISILFSIGQGAVLHEIAVFFKFPANWLTTLFVSTIIGYIAYQLAKKQYKKRSENIIYDKTLSFIQELVVAQLAARNAMLMHLAFYFVWFVGKQATLLLTR